jgi:hypothetical protein
MDTRNLLILAQPGDEETESLEALRKRYRTAASVKSPGTRVFVQLTSKGTSIVLCKDIASAIQKHPWVRLLTWEEYEEQVRKSPIK